MPASVETDYTTDSFDAKSPDEAKARRVFQRFIQARDAHSANRSLEERDHDFYDNEQWEEGVKSSLIRRNRPAMTINIVKPTIDVVLGIERTNRLDMVCYPQGPDDNEGADVGTQLLKYIKEQSDVDPEVSDAFADAVKGGIGWLEVDIRDRDNLRDDISDGNEDEPFVRRVDPKLVWPDPLFRRPDGSDMRWAIRALWFDIDEAKSMWSKFAKDFDAMLMSREDMEAWDTRVKDEFYRPDRYGSVNDWVDDDTAFIDAKRRQVLVLECQYKAIEKVQMMVTDDGLVEYDPGNPEHLFTAQTTPDEHLDTMFPEVEKKVVRVSMSCGPILLSDERADHKHNIITLVPIVAYMNQRGMWYGLIRQLIDSQKDYNKRRSTSLLLLAATRVLVETGAVKSLAHLAKQAQDPTAIIEVAKGALEGKKIQFNRDSDLAPAHVQIMQIAKGEVQEVSGVNKEMRGQGSGDQSGVAMQERKESASTMLAPLFDNYKRTLKRIAYMILSNCKQYIKAPRVLRLTEAPSDRQWAFVNQAGPDGNGVTLADMKVHITIEDAPASASNRQRAQDNLMQLVKALPPQIVLAILPEIIDASDNIPGKAKLKAKTERALVMMGVLPPDDPLGPGGGMAPQMMGQPPMPMMQGQMPPGAPVAG